MTYFSRNGGSVLRKMVLSYSIHAAILVGIIALFMISATNNLLIEEISRESDYRLERVSSYTEQALLRKYEETFANKINPSFSSNSDSSLLYFLKQGREYNETHIIRLVESLNSSKHAFAETDNITIHYLQENFLVDNNYYYEKPRSHPDQSFVQSLPQQPLNRWFSRTGYHGESLLTYIFTLPYNTYGDRIKGYMYIDLSVNSIKNIYSEMMYAEGENFYVFDDKGSLILSMKESTPDEMEAIIKLAADPKQNFVVTSKESGRKVISYSPNDKSQFGWNYAISRPMNTLLHSYDELRNQMLQFFAVVLAIGLFVSYFLSKRFYMPLKQLLLTVRNLCSLPKSNQPINEYNLINVAIDQLDRKIHSLEDELKLKHLINLMNGTTNILDAMLQIPFDRHYTAVNIYILEGDESDFVERFKQFKHSLEFEVFSMNKQEAAILYMLDSSMSFAEQRIEDDLMKFMTVSKADFRFRCSVGEQAESLEEIYRSWSSAKEVNRYYFLYPNEKFLLFSNISKRSGLANMLSYEIFENALKAGEQQQVDAFLTQFRSSLQNDDIHIEAVHLSLVQLASSLAQTLMDLHLQNKIISIEDLFNKFKHETMEESIKWISERCSMVTAYLNENAFTAHQDMVYRLKEYIDKNYQEDIALDTLAEMAGLSPSYVSTLFGEVMSVSFSEYLTTLRLTKASEYLRTGKKSVKEISSLVGYRNVQYFCTKFKERFGVTPVQFRSANHTIDTLYNSILNP